MTNILLDPELARLAIVFGVIIGILIYNRYGVTAGGAIVPGYLALFATEPSHIISTFGIALLTYYLVHERLRPRLMLWGRRLFEVEILVAFTLQLAWMGYLFLLVEDAPTFSLLSTVGFVLPGIIAHDMGRQGVKRSMQVTVGATALTFGLVMLVGLLRTALGIAPILAQGVPMMTLDNGRFLLLIGASVFVVILMRQSRLSQFVGTGGFVTAAYLVTLRGQPLDLLLILLGALSTYLIVTQLLMKQAIIFGRSKMALMILIGILMTWSLEFLLQWQLGYTPWPGYYIIVPMMMALLANDSQRFSPLGTFGGTAVASLVIFSGTQLLAF